MIEIAIAMCFLITPLADQAQTKICEQPGQLYTLIRLCYGRIPSTFI